MSAIYGGSQTQASGSSQTSTQGDIKNDVALTDPPDDSISEIAFSPTGDYLAVSSWNSKVAIYEVNSQGRSAGKALLTHERPVLSCTWSLDGSKVVGAGADNAARMLDLGSNSNTGVQVAAHDEPIRCVRAFQFNGNHMIATGSWDKKIKYWDFRSQQPAGTLDCQDRVYTMDIRSDVLVAGLADRYINIVRLGNPFQTYRTLQSPLKWQTRSVACFLDGSGFAVGSVEGRCAINYVEEKDQNLNFSFKCHRANEGTPVSMSKVYPVNSISFHPQFGTFATGGSDGTFHFWDKDAKHRLKGYPEVGGAITSTSFNRGGNIFAYAVSYDWSKGYASNTPNYPTKVMLHPVGPDECRQRRRDKK